MAKEGPDKDPAGPHVALAVQDVVEARAELDRLGINYWVTVDVIGPQATQLFLRDPTGYLIELHSLTNAADVPPAADR